MTVSRFASAFEPNVTPMLDVLLVLLVTFLSSIQVRRAMDGQLVPPCADLCAGGASQIVLEVLPGDRFRLNQRDISAAALPSELASIYRGRNEKTLYVAGQPGARYQDVVTAMDIAKSAGVRVIGIPPKSTYLER